MGKRFLMTFLIAFLLGSALITSALWFVYSADVKSQRIRIETKESEQVKLRRVIIGTYFHGVTSDLKMVAGLHELKQLVNKLEEYSVEDLKSDFVSFSARKSQYDQLRFLDRNGMEIIRVTSISFYHPTAKPI